jgi:hypothetical protein
VNIVKNCALSFGLFALALGFTATQARAQNSKGTINLPFQAYWGNAVIAPGEYTISLPTQASNAPMLYVSGHGKTIMVLLGPSGTTDSDRSYLRVENIGQAHVIREFTYAPTGRLIRFPVPKSALNEPASEASLRDTTVPVAASAGN